MPSPKKKGKSELNQSCDAQLGYGCYGDCELMIAEVKVFNEITVRMCSTVLQVASSLNVLKDWTNIYFLWVYYRAWKLES